MEAITLDPPETIHARLVALNQGAHADNDLHRRIAKLGGTRKAPAGVVLGIQLAMHDYCEGMPRAMSAILQMSVPDYIAAVVGPDTERAEFLAATNSFWTKVLES